MSSTLQRASVCYAAGSFGALVNSLVVWYLGKKGIPRDFGVAIAPALNAHFLYTRIVWGGLWGMLFLLPVWRSGFWQAVFSRGILLSAFPTVFQLFYFFPYLAGKGMMGLSLGKLTPVFVTLYNAVWGISAALLLYFSKSK